MLSLRVCLGSAFENCPSDFETLLCATGVLGDLFTLWSYSETVYIFKLCSFFNKSLEESLSDASVYNIL